MLWSGGSALSLALGGLLVSGWGVVSLMSGGAEAHHAVARLGGVAPWLGVVGGLLSFVGGGAMVWLGMRCRDAWLVRSAAEDAAEGSIDGERLGLPESLGKAAAGWNRMLSAAGGTGMEALAEALEGRGVCGESGEEGELGLAFAGSPHGMLVVDQGGTVHRANAAAGLLLGRSMSELSGRTVDEAIADESVARVVREVASRRVKSARSVEFGVESSQTRLRCGAYPLGGPSGASTLVLLEDITQQVTAREAQRMFLAHAAHELRTPLTNIRLNVEELVDNDPADEASRGEAVNVISQESRRLESIVDDLLSISEIEAGSIQMRPGDVRLENLLADLQADYKAKSADKQISLSFELPAKIAVIQGDRDKIELVMHNLLGNALKYTPSGGSVKVCYTDDEERIRIDVQDTGLGIGPDDIRQIFERFYRARDPRIEGIEGTGLGLAISRELVRLHGGDLLVESEVGTGSTFTMVLPRRSPAARAA
ncbi:MAG: sensor histidine kinase [Phycisphaerales bacterium]